VFSASLGDGGVFIAGTNWFAYQLPEDDLDVTSFTSGYSSVLDRIAALDATGLPVDLGISGVADHSTSLYGLLKGTSGSATGGLVGAINVIPAPGALLLASLGAAAVGWLRTKRHL